MLVNNVSKLHFSWWPWEGYCPGFNCWFVLQVGRTRRQLAIKKVYLIFKQRPHMTQNAPDSIWAGCLPSGAAPCPNGHERKQKSSSFSVGFMASRRLAASSQCSQTLVLPLWSGPSAVGRVWITLSLPENADWCFSSAWNLCWRTRHQEFDEQFILLRTRSQEPKWLSNP